MYWEMSGKSMERNLERNEQSRLDLIALIRTKHDLE